MPGYSHKNQSVNVEHFSMIPRADIPRSTFSAQQGHKTTFDAGLLVPVYIDEILPGDSVQLHMTAFARTATPVFPIMDNLHLDSFFFYVPSRLLWDKWKRFMGEQAKPNDSIDFTVPVVATYPTVGSIYDHMGIPPGTLQMTGSLYINALPLRAYNLIYNEWFRDQNLQDSVYFNTGDGPDLEANYTLLKRGKRHDYFTSCLPWPQKGPATPLPLGTSAPIMGIGVITGSGSPAANVPGVDVKETGNRDAQYPYYTYSDLSLTSGKTVFNTSGPTTAVPNIYADLTQATGATINALRQAFQIQKLLERDARGGTRYTEIVRSHFGVLSPDARLQRPEYLGGGSTPINITPIAQTSATKAAGTDTPLGGLGATATVVATHGFSQSFTEHGYIIGLVNVRADITYQQGIQKMWTRKTRYDFYWPSFAHLGEQAVLRREIYAKGNTAGTDDIVFGYQERWAEYRHKPSMITGKFRSGNGMDSWHLAQQFSTDPTLSNTFITDDTYNNLKRAVAAGAQADGQQLLFDSVFNVKHTRAMPTYSVPGFIDRF